MSRREQPSAIGFSLQKVLPKVRVVSWDVPWLPPWFCLDTVSTNKFSCHRNFNLQARRDGWASTVFSGAYEVYSCTHSRNRVGQAARAGCFRSGYCARISMRWPALLWGHHHPQFIVGRISYDSHSHVRDISVRTIAKLRQVIFVNKMHPSVVEPRWGRDRRNKRLRHGEGSSWRQWQNTTRREGFAPAS